MLYLIGDRLYKINKSYEVARECYDAPMACDEFESLHVTDKLMRVYNSNYPGYFLYVQKLEHDDEFNDLVGSTHVRELTREEAINWLKEHDLEHKIEEFKEFFKETEGQEERKYIDPLSNEIDNFSVKFENKYADKWFGKDVINDLKEISINIDNGCYRSALVLAGRVLEFSLKYVCKENNIQLPDKPTIGAIINAMEKAKFYSDPSLNNIFWIINAQRIMGVHSKERTPIPSREQACMVCNALLDVLNRTFKI